MKKLIAALMLLLAFSVNATAQENKDAALKAKKQASELSQYLGLNTEMNDAFARLFEQKITILEDKTTSQERKVEMSRVVEAKIRASLDGKQMEKLEKNPELLKKLIN